MTTYRFTVQVANAAMLERLQRVISQRATITMIELLDEDDHPNAPIGSSKQDRDQEIIKKYTSDPKANSCVKLAKEYGISYERICQILRPVNAIGYARQRRAAAQEGMQEESEAIKAESAAKLKADVEKGLDLIRGGMSLRQASVAMGWPAHSQFARVLGTAARAARLKIVYGRWRDFSKRRALVAKLHDQGLSIPKIVAHMQTNGDPNICPTWVYSNMPELKNKQKQGVIK